jgi:hypothetical protein
VKNVAGSIIVILASIRKLATFVDQAHQKHSCLGVPALSQTSVEEVVLAVVSANDGRGNSCPVHHDESWAMESDYQDSQNQVEDEPSADIQEHTYHGHHVVNAVAC